MFTTAICGESLIKSITHNGIPMELLRVPATIWCGSIAYAPNLTDEPDIPALLAKYQANCQYPKLHRASPEWSYELRVVKTLPLDDHGGAEIYICEFINTLVDERLQDEVLSFEDKMAIAAPICTTNWQYFKAGGPSLGGWGAFVNTKF